MDKYVKAACIKFISENSLLEHKSEKLYSRIQSTRQVSTAILQKKSYTDII